MKSPGNIPEETTRELERLNRLENHARTHGDSVTEITCRLRWADLYRASGASGSPLPPVVLTDLQQQNHPLLTHTPMWRVRQKLSPVVAIVRVEEVRFRRENGHEDNYWIEYLACGHEHAVYESLDYNARNKRRRCKECGDHALIAAGYAGNVEPEPEPPKHSITVFPLSPALNCISTTIALLRELDPSQPNTPRVMEIAKPSPPQPRREPGTAVASVPPRASARRG
jgi:hypothetical protein